MTGEFKKEDYEFDSTFFCIHNMIKIQATLRKDYPKSVQEVSRLFVGDGLRQIILDYYGTESAAIYLRNLEEFSSGADKSKLEFDFCFMKSTFKGCFVIYLDKNLSGLRNAEVYKQFNVTPD